ncbi:enoyl-CoA hydratase/isomerase family protein [Antrihabitans stalactiti]|uniref:Enoyl-CoA hydratase n=1 Tax=Antrihabitans stalactiti TaxID=2584121 RepID=A0A848KG29_9NOCA|nr:enoyl-CoA hydratase-related protein [Antrihabitans stalactiti]NMN96716.1 enoyl-CoA hydratase [Antrihabitans stalactiti]
MADFEYHVSDHVATIRLNRPERKNAFTLDMVDQWAEALRSAEADPEVRVVVLTGTGDAFCAGVDLSKLADRERTPLAERELLTKKVHQVAYAAEALSKPYLAAVNGVAVGAGMDMALMADIRIAAASARFSEGYIRVGLVPGDGGCFFLPRVVGTATALRLLWTGEFVGAQDALAMGLVSEVCPDDALEQRITDFAALLAGQPPVAVQLIKRAVRLGERQDLRTALDLIASHQAVATSTADSREAMTAFQERRPGVYTGR